MTSRDDLRVGDAEREVAMAALREHYAQGRLTREELDERLGLALSARTGRDLARVGADLPDPYDDRDGDPGTGWEPGDRGPRAPGGDRHGTGVWGPGRGRRPHHHLWGEHGHFWGEHGPGARHRHHAARHRHHLARRGGPPFAPVLVLLLVAGVATAGFGVLKFLLLAWLAVAVAGLFHHRRWHARGHGRRISPPGAF
ncbi:DUF1707 domain-containing protein [Streptosporangium fragile]|uniref:DUF1707 domain-containing protein n=1 Tax=Streptosporangium fragile TaxID=46186 RepID=A0ABN3VWZ7_9ACTN